MKTIFLVLLLILTTSVFSQTINLKDFNNWNMTDITSKGVTKEKLFSNMNRDLIKMGDSICSNRAMVWVYDLKRKHDVDAGKIFLFYTKKSGNIGRKTWWYHVAPVVNEKGSIFVLDAGFSGQILGALSPKEWLKNFSGSTNCKEIQAGENDLIERMFTGYTFPESTAYGSYDCYYKYTPAGYWTPSSVAMGLLGVDEDGKPVQYARDEINTDEVYQACVEAVSTSIGRAFGSGPKKCSKYLGL